MIHDPKSDATSPPEFDDISESCRDLGMGCLKHVSDVSLQAIISRQDGALVKGVLHRGDAAISYGESTAGKTFGVLDMAWHLACGKPSWHGRKVRRCPVLWLALEGVEGFEKRMLAALKVHGDPGVWFARLDLHVTLVKAAAGEKGVLQIVNAARELASKCGEPCGMVCIDTAGRATAGDSQNDSETVMAFVEKRMGEIQRLTGAAVMVLHHTNRSGDIRGSLDWRNPMDVVIEWKRNGDDRMCISEKIKDDSAGPLFEYVLRQVPLGIDGDGVAVTSCVVELAPPSDKPTTKKSLLPHKRFRDAYALALSKSPDGLVTTEAVRAAFVAVIRAGEPDSPAVDKARRDAWSLALRSLPPEYKIDGKQVFATKRTSVVDKFDVLDEIDGTDAGRTMH